MRGRNDGREAPNSFVSDGTEEIPGLHDEDANVIIANPHRPESNPPSTDEGDDTTQEVHAVFVTVGHATPRQSVRHSVNYGSSSDENVPLMVPPVIPMGAAPKKVLTAVTLLAVLYANCIGSGYGFEQSVGSAGPLITIIFALVIPWIWCLPTGLAVSELATAVRSNSGVLMWINVAFHPVVSLICVLITIFITFVGNATYPSLAAEYFENIVTLTPGTTAAVKIVCVVICAGLNISGVEIVGNASVVISAITISPFLIFMVAQIFRGGYNAKALSYVPDSINWSSFLSITSWNYANLENAGSVAEEVQKPSKTMLRAMVPLMFTTYVAYLMPVVAGVSAMGSDQDWSKWESGYWSDVAEHICGSWLKYWTFAGALVTSLGYSLTAICCTSRLLAGMGAMNIFPKPISRFIAAYHPKLKTPVHAILINSLITLAFSLSLDFSQVVALTQSLYCYRLLFVYGAVIMLRRRHPTLPRPFRLPCGTKGCIAFLTPAFLFSAAVAILSAASSVEIAIATGTFVAVSPFVSYAYVRFVRPNGFEGKIEEIPVDDGDDNASVESAAVAAQPISFNTSVKTAASVTTPKESRPLFSPSAEPKGA